jgi:hypothetical protein
MLPPPHSPSRAELKAARDARHRQRVKAHRRIAMVEYDGSILDLLLRTGWASEEQLGDARAVGEALGRMLAASARI